MWIGLFGQSLRVEAKDSSALTGADRRTGAASSDLCLGAVR